MTKEEILESNAKNFMIYFNLHSFKKSHPSLFGLIMLSMDKYADQQSTNTY